MSDFHRGWRGVATALVLIAGPALLLASGLSLPSLPGDHPIDLVRDHPAGYLLFVTLGLVGSMPFLLGTLALSLDVARHRPVLGGVAAFVTFVANCLAIADWGTELVTTQMGGAGLDAAAMDALRSQVDTAPAIQVPLQLSGLGIMVGLIVLAVGIVRARTAPTLAAVGLPVGVLANVASFAAGSVMLQAIGNGIMLVSMAALAWAWIRPASVDAWTGDRGWERSAPA